MDDDEILAEQQAYYRARAPEYDHWWRRQGRYDRGSDEAAEWARQVAALEDALQSFGATGSVLELAGGTGWWTERLAGTAAELTVVDGSPETLELNRARVGRVDVDYRVADLFDWVPERTWDVVFFSFWISHVPRPRVPSFLDMVGQCLNPGGRLFLIDSRNDPVATGARDSFVRDYLPDLHRRELGDGSEWRVVKVMYEPDELAGVLEREGWAPRIDATRWFVYGSAGRP